MKTLMATLTALALLAVIAYSTVRMDQRQAAQEPSAIQVESTARLDAAYQKTHDKVVANIAKAEAREAAKR